MAKFEEGFTYSWATCGPDPFTVVSRTSKTIQVKTPTISWRMRIHTDPDGTEWVQDSSSRSKSYRSAFTSRATWVDRASICTGNRRYSVQYNSRVKGMQITRISPYDMTEYHWAIQVSPDTWKIISPSGKHVATFTPDNPAPESLRDLYTEVAKRLVNFDAASNLVPRIDRT